MLRTSIGFHAYANNLSWHIITSQRICCFSTKQRCPFTSSNLKPRFSISQLFTTHVRSNKSLLHTTKRHSQINVIFTMDIDSTKLTVKHDPEMKEFFIELDGGKFVTCFSFYFVLV